MIYEYYQTIIFAYELSILSRYTFQGISYAISPFGLAFRLIFGENIKLYLLFLLSWSMTDGFHKMFNCS